jgi:aryl-alcohol dehydrogenase-like predicted oxidoreductase
MDSCTLGNNGPVASRVGLGCMGMSDSYGPADDAASVATIHAALEAGIMLLDIGDFYGTGHNELLIRRAPQDGQREDAFIRVKFGTQRDPEGAFLGHDGRPAAVKTALTYSLTHLGTDYVDLYHPARLDPNVPIEETVGAIAELVRAGYVRYVGLSEMGAGTIRRAHAVHPISAIQMEYSLMSRTIEAEILTTARELGIGVTAYGVLSRGLLSDAGARRPEPEDGRRRFPRFQGENLQRNRELVRALEEIAQEKGVSTAQLAIAWVLSRGSDSVPLIGARTI